MNSVIVTTVIGALILLISFGSTIALNIILSVNLFGFYSTYFLSCALLLYRRCIRDGIQRAVTAEQGEVAAGYAAAGRKLTWGPWHIPGWFGVANNVVACCYILIVIIFSFWPADTNPSPAEMNWSIVIVAAFMGLANLYYWFKGRHHYQGPVIEVATEEGGSLAS